MSRRTPEVLIAIVTAAIAICWWPIRLRFPFDDTFITFRYAANLADGYGIVWNPGSMIGHAGAHTEGYTNFLYVLLLAPFSAMGLDLVVVAQVLNVVAVAITAIAIWRIVMQTLVCDPPRQSQTKVCATLAVALFLLDPYTWFNALSGMETSLFVMWLVLAIVAACDADFSPQRIKTRATPFIFATLAALTRPEGALMGLILLVVAIVRNRSVRHSSLAVRHFLIAFVLPLAIYAVWKYWYFGNLLPNSFYVKVAQSSGLFPGRGTVRIFYVGVWYLVVLALIAVVVTFRSRWQSQNVASNIALRGRDPSASSRETQKVTITIATLWIILLSIFYCFSQLVQPQYGRFTYSIEVMLIVLASFGLSKIFARTRIGSKMQYGMLTVFAMFLIVWSLYFREGLGYITQDTEYQDRYENMARIFRTIPEHEHITFCWADAGILPYESELRHIDPVGLNTNEIAHAKSPQEVIDYIIQQRPEMIFIPLDWSRTSDSCRHIFRAGHGLIADHYSELVTAALRAGYVNFLTIPQTVYDIAVLVNRSSPHFKDVARTLSAATGSEVNFRPAVACIK